LEGAICRFRQVTACLTGVFLWLAAVVAVGRRTAEAPGRDVVEGLRTALCEEAVFFLAGFFAGGVLVPATAAIVIHKATVKPKK
jgi:hypothetical protein